jgi:hypothetical protein
MSNASLIEIMALMEGAGCRRGSLLFTARLEVFDRISVLSCVGVTLARVQ